MNTYTSLTLVRWVLDHVREYTVHITQLRPCTLVKKVERIVEVFSLVHFLTAIRTAIRTNPAEWDDLELDLGLCATGNERANEDAWCLSLSRKFEHQMPFLMDHLLALARRGRDDLARGCNGVTHPLQPGVVELDGDGRVGVCGCELMDSFGVPIEVISYDIVKEAEVGCRGVDDCAVLRNIFN